MLTKILRPVRRLLCFLGLHTWAPVVGTGTPSDYCTRESCKAARRRSSKGRWETFTRKEVTMEDVQKLNRHERRRLGALARQGTFGELPR